jgi:bifunctional non-homologous end joining protein LigD
VKSSPSTGNGIPRFQLLQRFQKQPTAPTLYYVFDVLWYNGDDLTGNPILERRSVLERILKPRAGIQLGSYVEDEGKALFDLTKEKGMEGIIAKRKDSIYRPGKRTSDGAQNQSAPATRVCRWRIHGAKMKPLFTQKCPFVNPPNIKEKIQWVRPTLVCEVEYAELTADDQLRQTTFLVGETIRRRKTWFWRIRKPPNRSRFDCGLTNDCLGNALVFRKLLARCTHRP